MRKIHFLLLLSLSSFLFVLFANLIGISKTTDPFQRLLEGNMRFQSFHPMHPDQTKKRLQVISTEQHPFAIIVSCSDSRVPPEIIFDQGLGDLFTIRTAGHVVGDYELASIEYAVEHLGVKTIVVLGHESCGAIKSFIEHSQDKLPKHLDHLIDYLREEPEEKEPLEHHNVEEAVLANIQHTKKLIEKDFEEGEDIKVYGLYYRLDNGKTEIVR